ncbi:MAG: hypothetical protein H0W73_15880 [Bacteroidetes bacterium]|nr:hypothetical protein [Bacteroidota bacterium]
MSAIKVIALLLIVIIINSCSNKAADNKPGEETNSPVIIDLQPFADIAEEQVNYVYSRLVKIYPNITIKKRLLLPAAAYYEKRNRYKADTIINHLRKQTPDGHVTMGLTSKDIRHTKGNVSDYGLMGLAYQPGKSGVVSYFRLSNKTDQSNFLS